MMELKKTMRCLYRHHHRHQHIHHQKDHHPHLHYRQRVVKVESNPLRLTQPSPHLLDGNPDTWI